MCGGGGGGVTRETGTSVSASVFSPQNGGLII